MSDARNHRTPQRVFIKSRNQPIFYTITANQPPFILAILHERMDLINRLRRRLEG